MARRGSSPTSSGSAFGTADQGARIRHRGSGTRRGPASCRALLGDQFVSLADDQEEEEEGDDDDDEGAFDDDQDEEEDEVRRSTMGASTNIHDTA